MNQRLHLAIQGIVQGVGFRPFIYRLAKELQLTGWVNNSAQGVFLEIEGKPEKLTTFLQRLETEKPPLSSIQNLTYSYLNPIGDQDFMIRPSIEGEKTALVLPDIATCSDCLQEIFDPQNRRYHYPFTNCTNCGPRYTIINALPYDRSNTTMKDFQLCPDCKAEYQNPLNRRFHAQPNACPQCGPHLELWNSQGEILSQNFQSILDTATAIKQGKILAIKGLGGFHLVVDARNKQAVETLRKRKNRPDKPFALMYPNLALIKQDCQVSELELNLLTSPQAPIVLLKRKYLDPDDLIAPENPDLGIMLPYTPIHHLLMSELNFPIVATSGNLADEPICIDEQEALERLSGIADLFLVHNRPIIRPVDDSIVREIMGKTTILRCARGYAPLPISVENQTKILAVGGHFKNTIAIAINHNIFLSQHIGDLATIQAFDAFQNVISSFKKLYDFEPEIIACDAHSDYISSQYAHNITQPITVQHHYAHVLACMAEHNLLNEQVLGVAWDGSGYGLDGTIWGGEFLLVKPDNMFERVAYLRQFSLPGATQAIKEPRRSAMGLLYEIFRDNLFNQERDRFTALFDSFSSGEILILAKILAQKLNSPLTSSMGRLFDGVAAILGLSYQSSFEGQGAMNLEFLARVTENSEFYDFGLEFSENQPIVIDWKPIIMMILADLDRKIPREIIATKFHNSLSQMVIKIARQFSINNLVLTGGCFQNKYLIEKTIKTLQDEGFMVYWPQKIPPNDGGIALGQIIAVMSNNLS
jgi:hydrogenase maturation protein HypF